MFQTDAQLAKAMMDLRVREAQHSVAHFNQQSQPSLAPKFSNLVRQVGHSLVTLGRRLEQRDLPQPTR